jgi:hypothetical protein
MTITLAKCLVSGKVPREVVVFGIQLIVLFVLTGKSGFFPNYYVEVVTENDIPKKDRDLFKKLDKAKEQQREKEEKTKAPNPRKDRTSIAFPSSPRNKDKDKDDDSMASSPRNGPASPRSAFGSKKPSEPWMR